MLLAFSALPLHRIQLRWVAPGAGERGIILRAEADRIRVFSKLLHRSMLYLHRCGTADRPSLQPVAPVADDPADVVGGQCRKPRGKTNDELVHRFVLPQRAHDAIVRDFCTDGNYRGVNFS